MALTSFSWSVWLHTFPSFFHFTAKFLPQLRENAVLERKAGRWWQQIADETVYSVYVSSCIFVFSLSDDLPGWMQQSGTVQSPPQKAPPVRPSHCNESVSMLLS